MICLYGTWDGFNSFTDHTGKKHFICGYGILMKEVESLIPFQCYIQLKIVKNVVIDNN